MLLIFVKLKTSKLANQLLKVKRKSKQEARRAREKCRKQAMISQQQLKVSRDDSASSGAENTI